MEDKKGLMMKELNEGIEAAKRLRDQILNPINNNKELSVDQAGINQLLIEKMISSLDKVIEIVKTMANELVYEPISVTNNNDSFLDSPRSLALSSPQSENSHQVCHVAKKRKTRPRWTKRVQIGAEGSLDDGFSWRKYGQKDIIGTKFPRGYYRCTHRPSQGCEATRQVQRLDEDSTIYQINYIGEHTCVQGIHLTKAQSNPNPAQIKSESQQPPSLQAQQQQYQTSHFPRHEVFWNLGQDEDHNDVTKAQLSLSFSFTSALLETDQPIEFLSCSPAFGSPTTSDSNYFPISPCRMITLGEALNVQVPDSNFNEAVSGWNSATNSPTMGVEFQLDPLLDIDVDFPFEY